MKKTLISAAAAALVGLVGQAHAQSVTIYGIVDAAVEHLDHVGASGSSITRMPGLVGGQLPSRLGFRGTEDLGGGMKAVFTMEMGFGPDAGTFNQGGRAFGRQAFVGISDSWGTLSLGRQYSMLFYSQLDADTMGPQTFGSGSLDSYLPNARVDNSIAYRGTFGGWNVGATYSFGRDSVNAGPSPSGTNCAGENATDSKACKQWSVMIKYDEANWGASLANDQINGGAGAFGGLTSSSMTDRRTAVAGWARFDAFKVSAGLISRRNEGSLTTPRSDLWYVGAAYTVTPQFVFDAEVFKLDFKNSANEAKMLVLRGTYNLSKRTNIYATAGHISNDGTLALSLSNGAAGGAAPVAGGTQNGLAIGMKHSF